ncbi:hypothetical protein LXL04_021470 [Taraxacum kok-saghyz]
MDIDPPPPAPPSSIFPDLDLKFRSQKNVAHVFWMMMLKWIRKSRLRARITEFCSFVSCFFDKTDC